MKGNLVDLVRRGLLKDLSAGKLRVGTKLVNEEGLASRFDVSRSTVREAVSALVSAGYLERRHGSGTYVVGLPGPRHALDATLSYTHMIAEAGMKPGLKVLDIQSRAPSEVEADELDLEPDETVRCLERIRTANAKAMIYSIDVVPERFVANVPDRSFNRSLYDTLEKIGHPVQSANAVLVPVIAERPIAKLLQVKVGSALQQIIEVDYARGGEPIVYSREWHVPGVFELRVGRRL
ncbi:MAG: GntR family transcriptional regulator [Acidimicrobiales bacterium]